MQSLEVEFVDWGDDSVGRVFYTYVRTRVQILRITKNVQWV